MFHWSNLGNLEDQSNQNQVSDADPANERDPQVLLHLRYQGNNELVDEEREMRQGKKKN